MVARLKATRYSAISQVVLGALLIVFGIADRATIYKKYTYTTTAFHTQSVVPIWMGAWIMITGAIGCFGSRKKRERPSTTLIGTYLGFSIVSIIFAGVIIIMYSIGIAVILVGGQCADQNKKISHGRRNYDYTYGTHGPYVPPSYQSMEQECNTSVGLGSMIIIFAIIEFGVGIWASICCCSHGNGCCNPAPQQQMGQIVYIQTEHGPTAYIMTQSANGVPVAVPAMISGQAQMVSPAPNILYQNSYDKIQHQEQPPSYEESESPRQDL